MTWREKRLVAFLTAVIAVLAAALLIVAGLIYRRSLAEKEAESESGGPETVLNTPKSLYNSLTYSNGTATLSFSQNKEGGWVWSDDTSFPLNDAVVRSILEKLTGLKPLQTLTDGPSPESCGLSGSPDVHLTATTENEEALNLAFGNALEDGQGRYALINGEDSPVYVLEEGLYQLLQSSIYDMCILPELPKLPAAAIQSITLQGPYHEDETPTMTTVFTSQSENGRVSWQCNGRDVTGDESLKALLEDLAALKFSRCLDYRPSKEAATLCGFDNPTATVRIRCRPDGSDADQTLTLTIGNQDLEQTGRCVRLDRDDTIYLLPTASLDPLMRLAVQGLG